MNNDMNKADKKSMDVVYFDEQNKKIFVSSYQAEVSGMVLGKGFQVALEEFEINYPDFTVDINDKVFEEATLPTITQL